ncbi:MAG: hypothetical protein PHW95_03455 [Patescibacteria group bacterium]|nr:hypothetical protein [Patescibacteria group bacterium]
MVLKINKVKTEKLGNDFLFFVFQRVIKNINDQLSSDQQQILLEMLRVQDYEQIKKMLFLWKIDFENIFNVELQRTADEFQNIREQLINNLSLTE